MLRADLDPEWTALHVVLIDLGAYLLEAGVSRFLGESLRSERSLARMERATVELFVKGVFRAVRRIERQPARRRRTWRPPEAAPAGALDRSVEREPAEHAHLVVDARPHGQHERHPQEAHAARVEVDAQPRARDRVA